MIASSIASPLVAYFSSTFPTSDKSPTPFISTPTVLRSSVANTISILDTFRVARLNPQAWRGLEAFAARLVRDGTVGVGFARHCGTAAMTRALGDEKQLVAWQQQQQLTGGSDAANMCGDFPGGAAGVDDDHGAADDDDDNEPLLALRVTVVAKWLALCGAQLRRAIVGVDGHQHVGPEATAGAKVDADSGRQKAAAAADLI